MDFTLVWEVLDTLNGLYEENPTGVLPTKEIAEISEITEKEAQGILIYLKEKEWINSFQNLDNKWVQKISAKGIDEFERLSQDPKITASRNIRKFEEIIKEINHYIEEGVPDDYPPIYDMCDRIKQIIIESFPDGHSRAQQFEFRFREEDAKATDEFGEYAGPNDDVYKDTNYALIQFASKEIQDNVIDLQKKIISTEKVSEEYSNDELLEIEPIFGEEPDEFDVFVSHRFVKPDIKLAVTLQKMLAKNNLTYYLAERKKDYGKHLSDKIKESIEKSKCIVAIITKNSKHAPSVNQEIGYALGFRTPVILLSEETEAPGVLVKGVENEPFKRDNFEKHCEVVLKHIPRIKKYPTKEEKNLIEKSAYYRQILEYRIHEFLDGVYYRLNIGNNNRPGLMNHGDLKIIKDEIKQIKKFIEQDENKLIDHFSKIHFEMFRKLDYELLHCKNEINDAERLPHNEMPQKEIDTIVKLKEYLLEVEEGQIDISKICQNIIDLHTPFAFNNCNDIMKNKKYRVQAKQILRYLIVDLEKIIKNMIILIEIFVEYKEKFGTIAFKNKYES